MASQKLNLTVDQGTDFTETLIAKNVDGTVQDVTGFTAAGQIRKSYTSDTATNFTVSFGDVAKGEVIISLARAQTSSLPASRYVYDVELTSAANKRSRLAEGQVTVTQEVTREGPIDFVNEVFITDPQDGAFLIYESANTNWVDSTQIRATSNTVLDVTGTLEADGFSGTGAVTVTDFIDDDSFGTANNTNIATAESVKAYVNATSAGKDALAELVDTNITSPSSGQFIIHDGTDSFDNKTISGDIAITDQGVASITAGSIVNADVNASAGIEISKTALVGGTGITLSGNTLSLTANSALTNLGGDGANTTHILRKDGTYIPAITAGLGIDLDLDGEITLSPGAALLNLGYDAEQQTFLRRDGVWATDILYYAGTGITILPNSNTEFESGRDGLFLSGGAALTNLGGYVGGDVSVFLNQNGTFTTPDFTDTTYTAGTGLDLNGTIFSLSAGAAANNIGIIDGANTDFVLNLSGQFERAAQWTDAGTGLTRTANTSQYDNVVFSVNNNLSNVVETGALNAGSITSGFGDIDIGANTVTAGSLDINGSGDVSGNLTVHGNFTVNGTETVVNSTTLNVDDKNIVLGSVDTPTDTTADGGGITLKGATDKTINWVNSTDTWTSSEHFGLVSGKQLKIPASSSLSSPDSAVRIETGGDGGTLFIFGYDSNHYIDFNSGGGSLYIGDTSSTDYATIHLADGFKTIGGTTEIFSPNFGADVLPVLSLHRDSASPATNDKLGIIKFNGEDSAGNKTEYATIHAEIADPTSGAEYGRLDFGILNNGTVEDPVMTLAPAGILLGSDNDLILGQNGNIQFEGNTSGSSIRTTLYCDDPNTNREIILPNASGTVVLKDSTDTLTNKSIDASQLTGTIDDARIPSGIARDSELSSFITASSSDTLTNKSIDAGQLTGTIADARIPSGIARDSELTSFITASSSDTLTNKSISGEQIDSGTIADARIAAASVTQHQGSITGTGALNAGSITSGFGDIDIGANTVTAGATTVNGALAVNNTAQSITDTTTNSTSVYGPTIELYRDGGEGDAATTSMTQSDKLGTIDFYGNNDAGTPEKIKYAKIFSSIYEETDGAESGRLSFSVINAGTHTEGTGGSSILDLEPDVAQFNQNVRIKASVNDAGVQATPTPILELFQEDGPTADDGDHLGEIQFTAYNDNGYSPIKHKYAGIHAEIIDETNNTEDGSLHFTAVTAGTEDTTVLTLNGNGSTLFSDLIAPLTIRSTTTDADLVITNSEDSSSDASPIIELFRSHGFDGNSDGDDIGKIEFYGLNDRGLSSGGPEKTLFASMFTEVVDSSDGTEDGQIKFTSIKAGSATDVLTLNGSGSTLSTPLEVTGGITASQTIANAVTDTDISVSEFATYNGKKIIYTGGAGSVHLADAVAADIGKTWTIINAGTGAITVNRATSTQTIKLLDGSSVSAGSANLTVATGGIIEIICTAADNYIAFGSGIS